MRRLTFAAIGLLMFSLAATAAAQGMRVSSMRVSSSWSGVYTGTGCVPGPDNPCVGELVTCGGFISPSQGVYHVLDGICNDFDPGATPCDGRYTWYSEVCYDSLVVVVGSLNVFHGVGKERNCFNHPAAGPGACAGTPTGDIISESSAFEQDRIDTNNIAAGYSGETFSTDVTTTPFFDPMDGKEKQLSAAPTAGNWTGQEDFTFPFCDLVLPDGCGNAGQTFTVGAPEPPVPGGPGR